MITREQYEAIVFGDFIQVLVYRTEEARKYRVYEENCTAVPDSKRVWLESTGFCARKAAHYDAAVGVLIPKESDITGFEWSESLERFPQDQRERIRRGFYGMRVQDSGILDIRKPATPDPPPIPCIECKQFYPMAIANFDTKLVCWSCRDSLRWKYGFDQGKVFLK